MNDNFKIFKAYLKPIYFMNQSDWFQASMEEKFPLTVQIMDIVFIYYYLLAPLNHITWNHKNEALYHYQTAAYILAKNDNFITCVYRILIVNTFVSIKFNFKSNGLFRILIWFILNEIIDKNIVLGGGGHKYVPNCRHEVVLDSRFFQKKTRIQKKPRV